MSYIRRKVGEGQVVSYKMDKTVFVAVVTFGRNPIYKKMIRKVNRYKAHDADNKCHVGDRVKMVETRPLSREKRWRIVERIEKTPLAEVKET